MNYIRKSDRRKLSNLLIPNMIPAKIGKFTIGCQIGQGGFSRVHRATHENESTYCVKIISKKKITSSARRLKHAQDEITVLSNLSHPNIVLYNSFSSDENNIYIFMEYCHGKSLLNLITERKGLNDNVCKIIFHQLLETLDFLHSHQICHRDIKPENIIVNDSNEEYRIKLIDFGLCVFDENYNINSDPNYCDSSHNLNTDNDNNSCIANNNNNNNSNDNKTNNDNNNNSNNISNNSNNNNNNNDESSQKSKGGSKKLLLDTFSGSLMYLSPEIIRGENYDGFKADMWAAGISLYAMVTGNLPWKVQTSPKNLISQIIQTPIVAPAAASVGCADVISSLLRLHPTQRPSPRKLLSHFWFKGFNKISPNLEGNEIGGDFVNKNILNSTNANPLNYNNAIRENGVVMNINKPAFFKMSFDSKVPYSRRGLLNTRKNENHAKKKSRSFVILPKPTFKEDSIDQQDLQ